MKLIKYRRILLALIILVAAFMRFYQLGQNPPSLTWDEAAWGYNAYSLGISARDEFGKFLPISYLESFGDFKPPLYAYLAIIPVKIFGLSEFATRFPSAFFGVFTVLITYFLSKRIFWKSQNAEIYALLTSFLLAISPWHIMLSRAAFEANVATFLIASGVLMFLAGVQGKKWSLVAAAALFALSFYTFNTARVFSPLIVLVLVFAFRKKLLEMKSYVVISFFAGLILLLPSISFLFSPQAGLRFREVNIFSDAMPVTISNRNIANSGGAISSKILDNRRVFYGLSFVNHYFDNLSPYFLFISGDGNPKFSNRSVGQMYMWECLFCVAGILFLFRKKEGIWWLVPVWLLLGIIPAATARETPHALRIETTLPMFQIITSYGIVNLLQAIRSKVLGVKIGKVAIGLTMLFAVVNFVYFYHELFKQYPYVYSGEWQYGYKESINYAEGVKNDYDYIQVTNALGRPYIYYLFYTKASPSEFAKNAKVARDGFGFVKVSSFGKYKFPDGFDHSKEKGQKVLYINTPYNLPKGIKVLKNFKLLNGETVLVAYTI